MKNKTNKIDWIIAECCSEADGAELRRFFGSEAEVRMLLLQLVRESRENDPDSYDNGTESEEEVGSYCSGWLNAYASFSSYHVDFTAVLFANMCDDGAVAYDDKAAEAVFYVAVFCIS